MVIFLHIMGIFLLVKFLSRSFSGLPYVLLNNVILVYSLFLYLQEERYSTRQQLLWIDMPWYLRVLHVFKQIPCYFLLLLFPFFSTCCPWSKVIFRLCLEIGREWQNAIFHSFVLRMRKITIYNMYVFPDVLAFSIYKIKLLEFQKNIMSFFILFPYIHTLKVILHSIHCEHFDSQSGIF